MGRHSASRSSASRQGLITIDQAIAGASNVVIAVLAARVLGVSSFGLFGVVFLVYVLVQSVSRSVGCDPLLVHPLEVEQRTGDVIGTVVILGTGLGALVVLAGVIADVWSGELGRALIVLGICLPLLTLQDLGRYLGFALQRPGRAVVLDAVWLFLVFAATAVLLAFDARTLTLFILAWAGSGALAGLLVILQCRGTTLVLTLSWLRFTWSFSWRYLISYLATQGAALAGSAVVGALAGTRALGAVQGTVLLVRPFGTLQLAAVAAGVADISRAGDAPTEVRRRGVRISTLVTGVALANAIVLLVLPDSLGELVLGDTWRAAKPLLLATGVQIVALGLLTGARAALLGSRAVRQTLRIDLVGTVLVLTMTCAGAAIDGVSGALWAVAGAQTVMAAVWWIAANRYLAVGPVVAERDEPGVVAIVGSAVVGSAAPASMIEERVDVVGGH